MIINSLASLISEYIGFKTLQNTFNANVTAKLNLLTARKLERSEMAVEVNSAILANPTIANLVTTVANVLGSVASTVSGYTFPNVALTVPIDANALLLGEANVAGVTLEKKSYLMTFANPGQVLFNATTVDIENKGDAIVFEFDGTQVTSVKKHDIDAGETFSAEIPEFVGNINDGQDQFARDANGQLITVLGGDGNPILDGDGNPVYEPNPYYLGN